MKTVLKYPLEFVVHVPLTVKMPFGSRIVYCAMRDGRPTLWAECNPEQPLQERRFMLCATGAPIDNRAAHVGTVFSDSVHVWHIYEQ